MKLIHMSVGGPDRVIVDTKKREWTFEDHPYFGPQITTTRGEIAAQQPGERSSFWPAYVAWGDQGKRLDGSRCVWDAPPPGPKLVWLGGRNHAAAGSALANKYGKESP